MLDFTLLTLMFPKKILLDQESNREITNPQDIILAFHAQRAILIQPVRQFFLFGVHHGGWYSEVVQR